MMNMPDGDAFFDAAELEYLRSCRRMTPSQRFDALVEMMTFLETAMPEEVKRRALLLRKQDI